MRPGNLTSVAGLLFATIASSMAAVCSSPDGDPSVDGVLEIVEPLHCGVFNGVTVVIEVQISSDGTVEKTTPVVPAKCPPAFSTFEEAAKQWRFEPSASDLHRKCRIKFTVNRVETDSPRGIRSRYENPLTLHVEYVVPTVFFIERIDGKIPVKICKVHGEPMTVERLPIRYGLWFWSDDQARSLKKYWRARKRRFPNAHHFKKMGDIVGSEVEAEVYVCAACMKARKDWIAEHPEEEIEPD